MYSINRTVFQAIQRHLQNPAPVAELTGTESTESVVRSVQGNKQTTTTSAVKTTTKTTVETQQHILPPITADQPSAVKSKCKRFKCKPGSFVAVIFRRLDLLKFSWYPIWPGDSADRRNFNRGRNQRQNGLQS